MYNVINKFMGLLDFIFGRKKKEAELLQRKQEERKLQIERDKQAKASKEKIRQEQPAAKSNLVSKQDLEKAISFLSKLSYVFQTSEVLLGGRNETMKSRTYSYIGILCYIYQFDYKYGSTQDIVDSKIYNHFLLVQAAMQDGNHKKRTIKQLADNWSDVLQVIFNLQLSPNPTSDKIKEMQKEIDFTTAIIEKLSEAKCKKPINPLNQTTQKVSYNPLNITEELSKATGQPLPDLTEVFAQELLPLIFTAKQRGDNPKDVVANYTISMIKSYYDNAGYVPMVTVSQITGQISRVVSLAGDISFAPYNSLKEYVLSKIYR